MSNTNTAQTIIFDLDGTLADSVPAFIDILNELEIIDHEITWSDYERSKDKTVQQIAKEFNVSLWRLPRILVKGRSALAKRMHEIPLFPGMDSAIAQLATNNHLFVMSSNSLTNVEIFLKAHGIQHRFEHVHGGIGVFSKAKMLRRIIKDQKLNPAQTYYVGDEIRDIIAAKKAGLRSVAVTWGLNGKNILAEQQPDYLVHTPAELQAIFLKDGK